MKRYYSTREVAELWEYEPRTIAKYCRQGLLPGAFQVGKKRMWKIPCDPIDKTCTGKYTEVPKGTNGA